MIEGELVGEKIWSSFHQKISRPEEKSWCCWCWPLSLSLSLTHTRTHLHTPAHSRSLSTSFNLTDDWHFAAKLLLFVMTVACHFSPVSRRKKCWKLKFKSEEKFQVKKQGGSDCSTVAERMPHSQGIVGSNTMMFFSIFFLLHFSNLSLNRSLRFKTIDFLHK